MQTVAQKLRNARMWSGLTTTQVAALAGTTASTVSRAESGKYMPAADTYLKILAATGFYDDGEDLVRTSNPSAIWTARWLMGDLADKPKAADRWITDWQRIGLLNGTEINDVESLLFRAGIAAPIAQRPNAVHAISALRISEIATELSRAKINYAITGDAGLERLGMPLVITWPVIYVADISHACKTLEITPRLENQLGDIITLLPFDGYSEQNRFSADNKLTYVTPIQTALDGYGGYGRMLEQASIFVKRWNEDE